MASNFFLDYQKQAFEWQGQMMDLWLKSFTLGRSQAYAWETVQSSLNYYTELMQRSLEAQMLAMKMVSNFQLLFWNYYFSWTRQFTPPEPPTQEPPRDEPESPDPVRSVVAGWFHLTDLSDTQE